MAQSTLLRSRLAGQITYLHFSWEDSVLQAVTCARACNWQLYFLNQWKGEHDHRIYFKTNFQESYVAELGFKLAVPGSAVRCATNYTILFVCVEVLLPSQPNGVMSSVVSLPNHTFTGKA